MIEAHYGEGFSITAFREHYSARIRRLLEAGIPLKPGVVELLDFLAERGLPLAVATSAARNTAERHLAKAGLLDRFAALATRDDVERIKPYPDIYLEAARRLGVAPEHCLAFEDSNIGLEAAHAAGTMAFMVPDLLQPLPESRTRSVDVFPDLHAALRVLRQHL
jgi:HAD superfamily hydrolase (TIGR01509 family)